MKHGGFNNENLKIKLNIFSYVYVEKLSYLKFEFGQMYFLIHFTMHGPAIQGFNANLTWSIFLKTY